MAHVSPATMQEWATLHAERSHELLIGVDAALDALRATTKGVIPPTGLATIEQQRIKLAEAHAQCALALSSAVVPTVATPEQLARQT